MIHGCTTLQTCVLLTPLYVHVNGPIEGFNDNLRKEIKHIYCKTVLLSHLSYSNIGRVSVKVVLLILVNEICSNLDLQQQKSYFHVECHLSFLLIKMCHFTITVTLQIQSDIIHFLISHCTCKSSCSSFQGTASLRLSYSTSQRAQCHQITCQSRTAEKATYTLMYTLRCANTQSECFWIETESDSDRIQYDGISKAAITALADWKAIRTHLSGSDQCSHPDIGPQC